MRYALLINEMPGAYAGLTEAERAAVTDEYMAIGRDDRIVAGGRLKPGETATTVRVRDGRTLTTDGPFADTKEILGGYYILDVDDVDAALDVARRLPVLRLGGSVEVRPVVVAQ